MLENYLRVKEEKIQPAAAEQYKEQRDWKQRQKIHDPPGRQITKDDNSFALNEYGKVI